MSGQYPPPPRVFSPVARTDSPQHGPPGPYQSGIKRQQLSPNPGSPYNSPSINNIALPNQVFSSPYYGTQANGATANHGYNPYQQQQQQHPTARGSSPHNQNNLYQNHTPQSFSPNGPYNPYTNNTAPSTNPAINTNYNTLNNPSYPPPPTGNALNHPPYPPQPAGSMGNMGPPSRPATADKPLDVNDLSDVIAGSGIDIREEEANLLNYSRPSRQVRDSTFDSKTNFYSQNIPGGRDTFYGAGTFNQPPGPAMSAEDIATEARQKATRRKAEIKSYHLNEPFVFAASLRRRFNKHALAMQVKMPTVGLYHAQSDAAPRQLILQGPDKNEVLKTVTTQDLLASESEYVELLSMLSLAAEERIRGLVEEAAVLAKGRRVGSHGIVPAEMADLVVGNGTSETANGLPAPDNSAISPTGNPLKRSYADMNKPLSLVSARSNSSIPRNPVVQILNNIALIEREQEIERLKKRQRRAEASRSSSAAVGTPGGIGEIAPDMDTKKGPKAKTQKDAAATKAAEAQQHAATTKTMNMALGLGGVMGKKLSWMKGAADAAPSNPYLPKANPNASSSKAGASGVSGIGSIHPKTRMLGEFREDRVGGAAIQLRDMISVLEHDGKERKALQRAYGMQGRERRRK